MTAYTGPTPYDKEITNFEKWWADNPTQKEETLRKRQMYALTLTASVEGYRRAKAEDAPLLEAARLGLASLKRQRSVDQEQQDFDARAALENAIFQAERKGE